MSENNKFVPPSGQEVCKDPEWHGFCGCMYATYTAENPGKLNLNEDSITWKMTEEHVAQVLSIPLEWFGFSDDILESCHKHDKYTLLSFARLSPKYQLEILNGDWNTMCWIDTLYRHLIGYLPVTQGVLDRVDHYNKLCKDNHDRIVKRMAVDIY